MSIECCAVKVVVNIDGDERVLGRGSWTQDATTDSQDVAASVLDAWDKARDAAERTLRLYGAEGVHRAIRSG